MTSVFSLMLLSRPSETSKNMSSGCFNNKYFNQLPFEKRGLPLRHEHDQPGAAALRLMYTDSG